MVIDNLDGLRTGVRPAKTNPILVIDADAPLTLAIPLQPFEAIPGRTPEIIERHSSVEIFKLPRRNAPQVHWTPAPRGLGLPAVKDVFGRGVTKGPDHYTTIARYSCYHKSHRAPENGGSAFGPF